MPHLFLSYGREDIAAAKRLYSQLSSAGVDVWVDFNALAPGLQWRTAVTTAIRESQFVVVLLSRTTFKRRGFLHREIREALEVRKEMPGDRPFLIPIRLEDCDVPDIELQEIQWINLFEGWDEGVAKLLRLVRPQGADEVLIRLSYLITAAPGTLEEVLKSVRVLANIESAVLIAGDADILVTYLGTATSFDETHEEIQRITGIRTISSFIWLPDSV